MWNKLALVLLVLTAPSSVSGFWGLEHTNGTEQEDGNQPNETEEANPENQGYLLAEYLHLQVTVWSEVVLDVTTDQWAVQLRCGTFTFLDLTLYHVQWIIPSGDAVNSSDYSDNHYNLLLANPVMGGIYVCRVRLLQAVDSNHTEASLQLDKMEARLAVLEMENRHLKQAQRNLSQRLESRVDHLQSQVQALDLAAIDELQTRVEKLASRAREPIGFHARDLESNTPPKNTPLIVNNVLYNHGNAYNGTTGYFTAPYPGIYLLAATTGCGNSGDSVHFELRVNATVVSHGWTYNYQAYPQMGTLHTLVHLKTGHTVHVNGNGDVFRGDVTSFSGVLISRDF